jgi:serine/threonine-protein kinase PknG
VTVTWEDLRMMACRKPGCTGVYASYGYCDACGHKAPASVSASAVVATSGGRNGTAIHSGGRTTRMRVENRGRLGADLVVVPPVPLRDPTTAIMVAPVVRESHRYCGQCGAAVGRGRDGQPGDPEGVCPYDGTPFSFVPRLQSGEVVNARYEIFGVLAHGGFGWIYLALDRVVSESGADRWVVLKGLIDAEDPDSVASALAERRFLVEVDHPNIVKIHDIVQHPDPRTGRLAGYTVMEYVGGQSLKELARANRGPDGQRAPLPLPQVLAYGLEMLPALGYLHKHGLLFCDFKPENVIQAEEQLKLIDLGGVRRIGDDVSVLLGTADYQAPELAYATPSVGSDLYAVGRALAVLSLDAGGFSSRYAGRLPESGEVALLDREESFYRFLRRSLNSDVLRRFQTAGEMADQLLGVLREVLSAADGEQRAGASTLFTREREVFGSADADVDTTELVGQQVAKSLPIPLVDLTDPAAGFLATLPNATVSALRSAPVQSIEVQLQLVRALIDEGDSKVAMFELQTIPDDGYDWRLQWYSGLIALAADRPDQAKAWFETVYDALPGEPAARLGLAAACEMVGDRAGAIRRYARVWRVDHSYVSAAFGLSRMLLALGDRPGAVSVLDEVPDTSRHQVAAQIYAVRGGIDHRPGPLTAEDFIDASNRLERLRLDTRHRAKMSIEMFQTALRWVGRTARSARPTGAAGRVLGHDLTERELRLGLERNYRVLATRTTEPRQRRAMVDRANAVRPWTVV